MEGSDTTTPRPEPPRVLVVAEGRSKLTMERSLQDCDVRLRFVDAADVTSVALRFDPDLLLIDGTLCGPHPERIAPLLAECRVNRVLLVPETTGTWMTAAHLADADAVVPLPLHGDALRRLVASSRIPSTSAPVAEPVGLPELVDRSDRMREVWRLVALAAQSDASVTILGETGVGKEIIARALHRFSRRRHGPFVAVNCAALPETLLESELFGHERGAFTGAGTQRKGRFELAHGGTLFLDEAGDLPLSLQVKLLRVLQERQFERVGGTKTLSVDVRVVSATHQQLEESVRRGTFRADLFFRLHVLSIRVPPLRRRKDDILPLWRHYVGKGARIDGRDPPDTSTPTCRRLLRHPWPGNVRELQNAAQHALLLASHGTIHPADLPELEAEAPSATPGSSLAGMTLKQVERAAILDTYSALGTVRSAAEALGVSERKLHYRLKQYRREGVGPDGSRSTPQDAPERSPATELATSTRVVLAEDDDELRWGLHDFLKCAGYQVAAVQDGRALLEHLGSTVLLEARDAPPDVIVTDIRMPFLTGLEVLQNVRARGWQTEVIVISAFGDDELRKRALAMGAAAFLDKPIEGDELLQVLRSVTCG